MSIAPFFGVRWNASRAKCAQICAPSCGVCYMPKGVRCSPYHPDRRQKLPSAGRQCMQTGVSSGVGTGGAQLDRGGLLSRVKTVVSSHVGFWIRPSAPAGALRRVQQHASLCCRQAVLGSHCDVTLNCTAGVGTSALGSTRQLWAAPLLPAAAACRRCLPPEDRLPHAELHGGCTSSKCVLGGSVTGVFFSAALVTCPAAHPTGANPAVAAAQAALASPVCLPAGPPR